MNEYIIPEYFTGKEKETPSAFVLPYSTQNNTNKTRIVLTTHVLIFVKEGMKEIILGDESICFEKSEFALISAGKCFMSEKTSTADKYESTLLFFDNDLLQNFFESHQDKIRETIKRHKLYPNENILFRHDEFTRFYMQSLNYVANRSEELIKTKLNEILLYLLETQPDELCCLFADHPGTSEEIRFKNMVTSHIDSNLTISELAYLCNVSLSTFKRKFTEIFNDSPINWIRKRRMEHAAFLLKYNKERVSDIYLRFGYENHSSFTQSFKNVFGVSPKQYQLRELN